MLPARFDTPYHEMLHMLILEFSRNPNTQNYKTNFRNRDSQPRTTPWQRAVGRGFLFTGRGASWRWGSWSPSDLFK